MRDPLSSSQPRLAITGATGRVARLLRPFLPNAIWLKRADDWGDLPSDSAMVCLAGKTTGTTVELSENTSAALRALDAAKSAGIARVFLLSSAAVYGRAASPLMADQDPTPAAPYGKAKADMEVAIAAWRKNTADAPQAVVLRLGNVAGADALLGNLTPDKTPELHIWPDGSSPRRSYIGPETLARAFETLAAARDLPACLNLSAPGTVEMSDLLNAAGHGWTTVPAPDAAIANVHLDTGPLETIMRFADTDLTAEGMVAQWRKATR